MPRYPYVSYTVTTPVVRNNKGWCMDGSGSLFRELRQTWSFTIQSSDSDDSLLLASAAHEWFSRTGNSYLSDRGIVAESVSGIAQRDNLLTVLYEYRNGFDVTLLLLDRARHNIEDISGLIHTATVQEF